MGKKSVIGIGILGYGVIGSGVTKILLEKARSLSSQAGCKLEIIRILEKDTSKIKTAKIDKSLFTQNASDIINDANIDIVIEVLGGEHPAADFIKKSLSKGKHVVTSNKEVMAKHFPEFLSAAQENGVDIMYEATVGGGIPLIAPFKQDLLANDISAIHCIINGTTNYILTRMSSEQIDFNTALKQAQKLGYAEPNPKNDIEGIDAAYKLAILATLAFHVKIKPEDIYHEGISRLTASDFRYANELGYEIKLLAIAKAQKGSIEVRVHPVFLPQELLLAKVDGVYNAVQVEGDLVGRVLFYGQGAGAAPTSSAILADVIDVAQRINRGISLTPTLRLDPKKKIRPMSEIETRYYLRMNAVDRPGVLAKIAKALADNNVSISSVIQKESDISKKAAEIVLMTYPAKEQAMQDAMAKISRLDVIKEISNFVRVED